VHNPTDSSGLSLKLEFLTIPDIEILKGPNEHSRTIAAHLSEGTIGISIVHDEEPGAGISCDPDETVATYAEMSVTQCTNLIC
jgi:hypothetical protein